MSAPLPPPDVMAAALVQHLFASHAIVLSMHDARAAVSAITGQPVAVHGSEKASLVPAPGQNLFYLGLPLRERAKALTSLGLAAARQGSSVVHLAYMGSMVYSRYSPEMNKVSGTAVPDETSRLPKNLLDWGDTRTPVSVIVADRILEALGYKFEGNYGAAFYAPAAFQSLVEAIDQLKSCSGTITVQALADALRSEETLLAASKDGGHLRGLWKLLEKEAQKEHPLPSDFFDRVRDSVPGHVRTLEMETGHQSQFLFELRRVLAYRAQYGSKTTHLVIIVEDSSYFHDHHWETLFADADAANVSFVIANGLDKNWRDVAVDICKEGLGRMRFVAPFTNDDRVLLVQMKLSDEGLRAMGLMAMGRTPENSVFECAFPSADPDASASYSIIPSP